MHFLLSHFFNSVRISVVIIFIEFLLQIVYVFIVRQNLILVLYSFKSNITEVFSLSARIIKYNSEMFYDVYIFLQWNHVVIIVIFNVMLI